MWRMSTITAILEPDADGTLHLSLPDEWKSRKVKVVATLEEAEEAASHAGLIGFMKDKLILKPGWDDPLDDFKEYME